VSGMKMLKGLSCLTLLLGLGGCHLLHNKLSYNTCNERQPYEKERSVAPLKIPSGLDSPDTTNALHLPQLNEPAPPPRARTAPCLDEPPSFKVAVQKPAPQA
jgi:uncharacterized lipoprotein